MPLVVAVAAQSAGNLGFHAVVGRLLPADQYGALGAVLAAMVMLSVPLVAPFGVSGALAGTLFGEAASLAVAAGRLRQHTADGHPAAALKLRTVARAAVAVTGLFLFSTVDLLLARHYLRGGESGAYVAA